MEPFEPDELPQHELFPQQELDELLSQWQAPAPPASLRAKLFPESARPWWRRVWTVSVRVPLPVACCLAVLFAVVVWRAARRIPVVQQPPRVLTFEELRPVVELRPRIIRSGHVQN